MKWLVGVLAVLLFPVPALARAPSISGSNSNITVVSGPSGPRIFGDTRGRLVVACDMRSDTCSNGRKITTMRASPVPCETSSGVWEMVPANQGCYSVRGLESWAANTSYIPWGGELQRSIWGINGAGATLTKIDDGYKLCRPEGGSQATFLSNLLGLGSAAGETRTSACYVRKNPPSAGRISTGTPGGQTAAVFAGPDWTLGSSTSTFDENGRPGVLVYVGLFGETHADCIDISTCWHVKGSTPGRPCWGGEAPVTCAGDRHTISTEGWPTTEGEFSFVVTILEPLSTGRNVWLLDGRDNGTSGGVNPYIQPDGRLRFRVGGTVHGAASPALTWEVGRSYALRFQRGAGTTYIYRDGSLVYQVATADWVWAPYTHLGMNYSFTAPDIASAISNLRVRSFE